MMDQSRRTILGTAALLGGIALWAVIVASFSGVIGSLWWPLQFFVYLIAGIVWIFPMMPLMRWMATGRWR
jgi:hypothetical protein